MLTFFKLAFRGGKSSFGLDAKFPFCCKRSSAHLCAHAHRHVLSNELSVFMETGKISKRLMSFLISVSKYCVISGICNRIVPFTIQNFAVRPFCIYTRHRCAQY